MEDQFTTFGTARVMVSNISYERALPLADTLEAIDGISAVDFRYETRPSSRTASTAVPSPPKGTAPAAVEESEGYAGAVSGGWDREDGVLSGNRFVEGFLAGVDGISYAGQEESVAYEDPILEDGVPRASRHFTATYSYGQPLSDALTPEVPEKTGCYTTSGRTSARTVSPSTTWWRPFTPPMSPR